MAEELHRDRQEVAPKEETGKGGKKKLLIIVALVVLLLGGGVADYLLFFVSKGKGAEAGHKEASSKAKTVLVPLDPFVLNLAEQGRFLKMTMQLELNDQALQPTVTTKMPQLRDVTITLVSSKSVESVSSPEGKFQLKDELLLRANQVMGKDAFKNLYFTEFIMQ